MFSQDKKCFIFSHLHAQMCGNVMKFNSSNQMKIGYAEAIDFEQTKQLKIKKTPSIFKH